MTADNITEIKYNSLSGCNRTLLRLDSPYLIESEKGGRKPNKLRAIFLHQLDELRAVSKKLDCQNYIRDTRSGPCQGETILYGGVVNCGRTSCIFNSESKWQKK